MLEPAGALIGQDDIDMVVDALHNMNGPNKYYYVEQFEKEFAKYHHRTFALMTTNCTSAIHLFLSAMGIGPGDFIAVPDLTWIGSVAGISWLNADLWFCDIGRKDWCIDPGVVERLIVSCDGYPARRPKAIIAVNLYGNVADWDSLQYVSDKYNIPLIEDAAESIGSLYKGKRSGSFGEASVFSFHRTKTVTTGEGGMLLLDDERLYKKCQMLRDQGRKPDTKSYMNEVVGYKYVPSNMSAALGLSQFRKLKQLVQLKRRQMWYYRAGLLHPDLQWNDDSGDTYNSAWITALVFGDLYGITKKRALAHFESKNIPCRPFFYPLSSLPAYVSYGGESMWQRQNPIAYDISNRGINLPGSLEMTTKEQDVVLEAARELIEAAQELML